MGRFDTLNADTQDLVNCLLPALATSFKVSEAVEIIPEDIRMRAWDCERRDHIKDETENDPRNWGVQFLKDLMAISRIKKGDLELFHQDLRAKVTKHEEKHPWCRLSDIKELKDEYEHPNRKKPVPQEESGSSSTDSYLEELHEPDLPSGMKRGRHEIYEARVQQKRPKVNRLRRSDNGGFERKDKAKARKYGFSMERDSPADSPARSRPHLRRPSRIVDSEGEEEEARDSPFGKPPRPKAQTPSAYSMSPAPARLSSVIADSIDSSDQPLAVQKMEAELEVAEAELKAARLKYLYCKAKEEAEEEARLRQAGLK